MVADTSIKNPKWNDFGEKITDDVMRINIITIMTQWSTQKWNQCCNKRGQDDVGNFFIYVRAKYTVAGHQKSKYPFLKEIKK
jgi:hypothetical protein